jgi:hypothetical protein
MSLHTQIWSIKSAHILHIHIIRQQITNERKNIEKCIELNCCVVLNTHNATCRRLNCASCALISGLMRRRSHRRQRFIRRDNNRIRRGIKALHIIATAISQNCLFISMKRKCEQEYVCEWCEEWREWEPRVKRRSTRMRETLWQCRNCEQDRLQHICVIHFVRGLDCL